MQFDFQEMSPPERYKLLLATVLPRPHCVDHDPGRQRRRQRRPVFVLQCLWQRPRDGWARYRQQGAARA
jgi:hypothetical protein